MVRIRRGWIHGYPEGTGTPRGSPVSRLPLAADEDPAHPRGGQVRLRQLRLRPRGMYRRSRPVESRNLGRRLADGVLN